MVWACGWRQAARPPDSSPPTAEGCGCGRRTRACAAPGRRPTCTRRPRRRRACRASPGFPLRGWSCGSGPPAGSCPMCWRSGCAAGAGRGSRRTGTAACSRSGPDPVTFVMRDAVPADLAALRDVYRRASLSNEGDRMALLANPDVLEFPGLGGDGRRTRVATADGRIAGFATSLPAGDVIELDDLFVDPGWMRQGAGRALVLDAVAIARDLGAARIEVTANQHALAFYGKAGFIADHEVQTRFAVGIRMHLDVTP